MNIFIVIITITVISIFFIIIISFYSAVLSVKNNMSIHAPSSGPNKKCQRCGLLYETRISSCPHCSNLNYDEIQQMLNQMYDERANIGKNVLKVAVIFVLITIVSFLWL